MGGASIVINVVHFSGRSGGLLPTRGQGRKVVVADLRVTVDHFGQNINSSQKRRTKASK